METGENFNTSSIHHFINHNVNIGLPYFRLSPWCTWNLHSPRLLRSMSWLPMFQACVSAQHTKVNMLKTISWHCDTISRNVSEKPTYAAQRTRTGKILVILIQIIIFCEFYFCDFAIYYACFCHSPYTCNCNTRCSNFKVCHPHCAVN